MANAQVLGDSELQSQVLEDLAEAVNYRRWQADLAMPHLGEDPIEIGSGSGDFAATLEEAGRHLTVSEADTARLSLLQERFQASAAVTVREMTVPIAETASFSSVVAFNVLEHIPDDVAALRSFGGLVRPGGRIVIFVPAFAFAMSEFDRSVGHQRRYTAPSLRAAMEAAGLRVVDCHYVNAVGLPAWVVGMRLLRSAPKSGPALRFWDSVVIPRARRLESWRRPPFGQSVFCVAERP